MLKTLDEIADEVHKLAIKNGWHLPGESDDHFIERACNNLHNEISELHEAYRNNNLYGPCDKSGKLKEAGLGPLTCIEEEYADIIIRALDNCKRLKIDILRAVNIKHEFNQTRPYRHGGKKS